MELVKKRLFRPLRRLHARDTRAGARLPALASGAVGAGSLLFDGFVGGYEYIGWTIDPQYNTREEHRRGWRKYATVHNVIVDEHTRLIAAFRDAKTYLEAKYPDKVFVEITGFFPDRPRHRDRPSRPADAQGPRRLHLGRGRGQHADPPRERPDLDARPQLRQLRHGPRWYTPCFGTNFLHIYCGYQADQGFLPPGQSFTTYRDQQYPDISDLTDSRVNFSNSKQGL